MDRKLKIGVLALQGGFIEHIHVLQSLQVESFEIRKKSDLKNEIDGLILPGGESTVIGKLLKDLDMYDELRDKITNGMPVFGTCAGMIMLAGNIAGTEKVHFGVMNITVKRNAYGRQLGSFFIEAPFGDAGNVPMTFIRAPYIESAGDDVEILSIVYDHIVAAREKNCLVTSFHPELTSDSRVHKYFIDKIVSQI